MREGSGVHDDAVLGATRWTVRTVVPVLTVAGAILYGFPGETDRLWAWPVAPELTALTMGGGYLAGALFFVRATRSRRWHEMAVGILGASLLSVLLLLATLLHWDRFSHGNAAFWVWLVVYVVAPVLLPGLWLVNGRRDPGSVEPGTRVVPRPVRLLVGGAGVVQLAVAAAMFARPAWAETVWPWQLSPLTARTVAAFIAFVAVVWLGFLFEVRWSGLRLPVESAAVGLVLLGLGVLRASGDLGASGQAVTVFTLLLASAVAGLVWLLVAMGRPAGPGPAGGQP